MSSCLQISMHTKYRSGTANNHSSYFCDDLVTLFINAVLLYYTVSEHHAVTNVNGVSVLVLEMGPFI